jgi:hypothetical protein
MSARKIIKEFMIAVVVICLIWLGFSRYQADIKFKAEAASSIGIVIRIEISCGVNPNYCNQIYTPIIQFKTREGKTTEFRACSELDLREGQVIDILYATSDPNSAMTAGESRDSCFSLYLIRVFKTWAIFILFFAIFFVLIKLGA